MSEGESKFGFKDMEKALETLQLLESHDMQYRKLTVRGLLGRAKRVLTSKLCPGILFNCSSSYVCLFPKNSDQGGRKGEEYQ